MNAARAIEASWVAARLIPGPPTPTSEIPLTVFLSGDREEGFRVCPTYQIPHLGALPVDLSMEGLPLVSEDVTLKLMSDDVLYPADFLDLVENDEDELDVGVEEHMDAVQEVSSGLTESHVGDLFANHQQLLLVFVSADSKGVYIGLVATRIDVVPAGAEAYPKDVNGVRVLLFDGGIDLMVNRDATMSPALAGAAIGPDPKERYGTLGAVVRDHIDPRKQVVITAAHVLCNSSAETEAFMASGELPEKADDRTISSSGGDFIGCAGKIEPTFDLARIDDLEPDEWDAGITEGWAVPPNHPMAEFEAPGWFENGLRLNGFVPDLELDTVDRGRHLELYKLGAKTGLTGHIRVFCTSAWAKTNAALTKHFGKYVDGLKSRNEDFVPCDMYKGDPTRSVAFDKGDSGSLVWSWTEGDESARAVGIYTGSICLRGMKLFLCQRATVVAEQLGVAWPTSHEETAMSVDPLDACSVDPHLPF